MGTLPVNSNFSKASQEKELRRDKMGGCQVQVMKGTHLRKETDFQPSEVPGAVQEESSQRLGLQPAAAAPLTALTPCPPESSPPSQSPPPPPLTGNTVTRLTDVPRFLSLID